MYNQNMPDTEKLLEWIGSSHRDLMTLSTDVRRLFGYALSLAQAGDQHDAAKVLKGFGSAGVLEVVEDDTGGTYRAEKRYGHHPRQAESGRGARKGVTK